MNEILAGSTPRFYLKIKNELGVQIDPSDTDVITEIKVFLYNSQSGTSFAKFYLNTLPGTGWTQMTVKEVTTGDKRLVIALTAAQTLAAVGNLNMIQVDTTWKDTDMPGNARIEIQTGRFYEVLPAKTT